MYEPSVETRRRVADLDLRTKIGQLFAFSMADAPTEVGHRDRDVLRRLRPGGLVVYAANVASRAGIERYLAGMQAENAALGRLPLIVCADHRGGDYSIFAEGAAGIEAPAPLAASAIPDDPERIGESIGRALGRDAGAVGLNLNLAPFGDPLAELDVPFKLGNSMMGGESEENAALAAGLTRGMGRAGLGTTYCTFPGGYGDLEVDPHYDPGVIDLDRDALETRYLSIARAAVAAGVDSVMLSHFQYPALDPESRPGTYSEPVIECLREEIGFEGVVMTDDLNMDGVLDPAGGVGEAAVRAISAGADMILYTGSDWETPIDALLDAVREGRISQTRLDEAVGRLIEFKLSVGHSFEHGPHPKTDSPSKPEPTAQGRMTDLIRRSMTWLRRPENWNPVRPDNAVVVARWRAFLDAAGAVGGDGVRTMELPVRNRKPDVGDLTEYVLAASAPEDRVVFATATRTDLRVAERVEESRNVTVSHAGWIGHAAAADVSAILVSYSRQPIASRAALEVLLGGRDAPGEVPVAIE